MLAGMCRRGLDYSVTNLCGKQGRLVFRVRHNGFEREFKDS